jgi:hypothetical protein
MNDYEIKKLINTIPKVATFYIVDISNLILLESLEI